MPTSSMHHMKMEGTRTSVERVKQSGWKWKWKVEMKSLKKRTHMSRKFGKEFYRHGNFICKLSDWIIFS